MKTFFLGLGLTYAFFSQSLFASGCFDPYEFQSFQDQREPSRKTKVNDVTYPDLEDNLSDFILETKKIEIPGYPQSFNPTIIRWKGGLLMGYRQRNPATNYTSPMGLVWIDEDFNLLSEPQELEMTYDEPPFPMIQQDPRLIAIGEDLFIIYSNMRVQPTGPSTKRVYIAKVHYDGKHFTAEPAECITQYPGERKERWEKNWVPFDYNGQLHFAYSLLPHVILRPLLGTGCCETVCASKGNINWPWGALRGGSTGLREGNEYLSFFHSSDYRQTVHSNGLKIQHYFMGAYTFSANPPFQITRISPAPIIGKNFYHGTNYKTWKPVHVVFPGGHFADEKHVWVFYGRQDHEIWVAKLDKAKLLASLIPVN